MSAQGSFWGIPRTARSVAIAIHTRSRGRAMDVDAIEKFILEELDALDIPPDYAVAMVTRVAFLLGEMRAPLRALRNELTKQAGEP